MNPRPPFRYHAVDDTPVMVSAAIFRISEKPLATKEHIKEVKITLGTPLEYRGNFDSEFQTFQMRVLNAGQLFGGLPDYLEPYRNWYVRDVLPVIE